MDVYRKEVQIVLWIDLNSKEMNANLLQKKLCLCLEPSLIKCQLFVNEPRELYEVVPDKLEIVPPEVNSSFSKEKIRHRSLPIPILRRISLKKVNRYQIRNWITHKNPTEPCQKSNNIRIHSRGEGDTIVTPHVTCPSFASLFCLGWLIIP